MLYLANHVESWYKSATQIRKHSTMNKHSHTTNYHSFVCLNNTDIQRSTIMYTHMLLQTFQDALPDVEGVKWMVHLEQAQ
jgi:hypothetical protein